MASLPEPKKEPSNRLAPKEPRAEKIRKLFLKGYTSEDIARKLAKGDKRKYRVIKTQCALVWERFEDAQQALAARARMELGEALPDVAKGVSRRAKTGRAQEAKLVFEASGFHNPKVNHDHSGEISVKLDMPRPALVETTDQGDIVDAEVLDD